MPHTKLSASQPVHHLSTGTSESSRNRPLTQASSSNNVDNSVSNDSEEATSVYEKEELCATVIQYLLLAQRRKCGLVKLSDLRKVFPKTFEKKAVNEVLDNAVKDLKDLFGIEVCIIDTVKGTLVVLRNEFVSVPSELDLETKGLNELEEAKKGILLALLTYLYMAQSPNLSSSTVSDAALFDFLETLGLRSCTFPQFDLRKLVDAKVTAEFVAEGWIDFEKSSDKYGTESVTYTWGPRAKACIDAKDILDLFCKIDGSRPEDWKDHIAALQSKK